MYKYLGNVTFFCAVPPSSNSASTTSRLAMMLAKESRISRKIAFGGNQIICGMDRKLLLSNGFDDFPGQPPGIESLLAVVQTPAHDHQFV